LYSTDLTIEGLQYHLSLTDTAGQKELRSPWDTYRNSDVFLLVYDITISRSLDALQEFVQHIDVETENREMNSLQILPDNTMKNYVRCETRQSPITFVVSSKCDLEELRVITREQGLEWARAKGYEFMETSAMEMVNVDEILACQCAADLRLPVHSNKNSDCAKSSGSTKTGVIGFHGP